MTNMKKRNREPISQVFIVSEGEYSDYHIHKVFSTKRKALAYIRKYDEDDIREQEERIDDMRYDLNNPTLEPFQRKYFRHEHGYDGSYHEMMRCIAYAHKRLEETKKRKDGYSMTSSFDIECFEVY